LLRLAEIASFRKKVIPITLRINPLNTPKEFAMKMGGTASQFGVAEEDAERVTRLALDLPSLHLKGFHIYAGTQCLEISAIVQNARQTLDIVERLSSNLAYTPEIVNLGGGFGIPYFADQFPIDEPALAEALSGLLSEFRSKPRFLSVTPVFELGRFLIGMHGVYVSKVVDIKETRGKRIVILDGGMHHCFPATGFFGQLVKKNYVVRNLSVPESSQPFPQELVGPLCTPMDSMARNLALPLFEVGHLAAVCNVGAYAFSASPLLFLGHETPVEIVHLDGCYTQGRPSRSVLSLFA
jgi:diaminopimelate decarboxylase